MKAWQELGVAADAPLHVVRRAWRAAARQTHPDRGGDPAIFQRKQAAWAALRGRAARGLELVEAPPPRPWSRARAIKRAVELDLDVEDLGDTTGVAGGAEVVWFTDAYMEVDGWTFPWPDVDDCMMWNVWDLVGAAQAPQD